MSLADASELIMSLPGDLPRAVLNEFRRGWRMTEVLAQIEQKEIAAAQPERTWCDGLGQMTLSIQADAYHYWGQRLGYKCWADRQFRHEFARDNPEVRVRSRPRKTIIRLDGFKEQGGEVASRLAHNQEHAGSIPAPATTAEAPA